jgi:hypothetical protein
MPCGNCQRLRETIQELRSRIAYLEPIEVARIERDRNEAVKEPEPKPKPKPKHKPI